MSLPRSAFVIGWALMVVSSAAHAAGEADLARDAYGVLQKYCIRCHGDEFELPGLDLRDRATLLRPLDASARPYLTPEKPGESRIWQVLSTGQPVQMPPEDQPQPTAAEKELVNRWIIEGAIFPVAERPVRIFLGENTLLGLIAADLEREPPERRPFLRYFSLAHLWNNPEVSDEHLRLVRAGVSKMLNSLSSQATIVRPQPVDPDGILLQIDLRNYGWTNRNHWLPLIKTYPFGLHTIGKDADAARRLSACQLPYVRADWFVYHAARPPLYHQLVTFPDSQGIPDTLSALEQKVGVDLKGNFDADKVARGGFSGEKSGVSDHNRIVERHEGRFGWYWPSYDSGGDGAKQNFFLNPLGPVFSGATNVAAFEHDGGEMIFALPNKLQGYMLTKSNGERINEGPLNIVSDSNAYSGTNAIVNGISCIGCHRTGIISFEDKIRPLFVGKAGDVAAKVLRIFPERPAMEELVNRDRTQFLTALEETIGVFLREGPEDKRDLAELPEPITSVSKAYDRPRRIEQVSFELGLPLLQPDADRLGIKATSAGLAAVLKFSETFRRLELNSLSVGEAITRKQWESAYQRSARELGLGTPLDVE